jgi:hypothetical protein
VTAYLSTPVIDSRYELNVTKLWTSDRQHDTLDEHRSIVGDIPSKESVKSPANISAPVGI